MLRGEKKLEHIMNAAMLAEPRVQRAIMRGYYELDEMSAWSRDPRLWFDIARVARPSRELG